MARASLFENTGTPLLAQLWAAALGWLWTNGVETNGAAAKVMIFDRLGKNTLAPFGEIKVG